MRLIPLLKLFEKIVVSLVIGGLILVFALSEWDRHQSDLILKQVITAYAKGDTAIDQIVFEKPEDLNFKNFSENYKVIIKDSLPIWGHLYLVKFISGEQYAFEISPGIFAKHLVIYQGKVDENL